MNRAQVEVVRLPGRGWLVQRALDLCLVHMSGQDRRNRAGQLILDGENVLELTVVALGPAMGAGHGIDELHGDTNPVTTATNAALQDVTHSQLAPHLTHVRRSTLVLEG